MGEAEDLVKNTAGAAENPVNHSAGAMENPINDEASLAENPMNKEAADAENPVSDQSVSLENPANDKSDGTVNPVNAHASGAENPASDLSINSKIPANDESDGAINPVNTHEGSAENSLNDQTDGAENPVKDQATDAENPVKGEACGVEHPSKDQVGGAGNPVNHKAGEAENPVNSKVGSSENPITDTGDIENSVHDEAVATENAVIDKACGIENLVNDPAGGEENPLNKQADAAENPLNIKADIAENPANVKQDAAKILVEDKPDAVETPVNKADCLPQEAKEILKSLASKWEDVVDANALQVIPLKGAMTNKVFQIKWPTTAGETSRKVIVRIYGEGVNIFFDRHDEIRTFEFMSRHGQGPRLLGRFANGRVEEFIHARTLSASDLRDPSISALIAAKMKEFHELDMPGEKKVFLWDRLRNWLGEAKRLSSPKEVEAFYLDTIDKEISLLEKELSGAHQLIGFCHNDLQYGNIMLDEETNAVTIIDYEYASYNPAAYDIANHFCEMAANYHTETPHILDYSKYPDVEERRRFVQAYLSSSGEQPRDSEMEELLQEIEKYTLANHLFWGVWGIISAQVNKIDFDYKEYAKQRFQEYWARKPYLLSYDAQSPCNMPEGTGELAAASSTTSTTTKAASTKHSSIFRKIKRIFGLSMFRSKS